MNEMAQQLSQNLVDKRDEEMDTHNTQINIKTCEIDDG